MTELFNDKGECIIDMDALGPEVGDDERAALLRVRLAANACQQVEAALADNSANLKVAIRAKEQADHILATAFKQRTFLEEWAAARGPAR